MNEKYESIKKIINEKLIERTETRSWEELSQDLFGRQYASSNVRKGAYGMKRLIDVIEGKENNDNTKILSLSDFHIPFELPISTFESYKNRVDILQLNGDLVDMQSISKFGKTYRVPIMEEIIKAREYFIELIKMLKPQKVVITYGNHEVRFENYLAKALENDMVEFMPQTPLEMIFTDGFHRYNKRENTKVFYEPLSKIFTSIEIDYVKNWYCQIGKAIFCHPLAYRSVPMGTSERAMQWFRNEGFNFDCLVMAHTHKIGNYKIGNTTLYEQGCCCDTSKCKYANGRLVNSAKEGFLYLIQDKEGNLIAEESKLIYLN